MSENDKKCPFCAEDINIEAIKCKHCGSMLNENNIIEKNGKTTLIEETSKKLKDELLKSIFIIIASFIFLFFGSWLEWTDTWNIIILFSIFWIIWWIIYYLIVKYKIWYNHK